MKLDLLEFLTRHEVDFKGPNSRGYISTRCYSCDKKKLEVSVYDDEATGIKKGRVKCWSCGAYGLVDFLCSISGMEESEIKRLVYRPRSNKDEDELESISIVNSVVSETVVKRERISDIIQKYEEIPLPMYVERITPDGKNQRAVEYLEGRGIARSALLELEIYSPIFHSPRDLSALLRKDNIELPEEEYRRQLSFIDRVIFPILINGKNYGYVARDYSGAPGRLKVLNSKGPLTFAFVYNFDQVKKSETLVINEGIFDSIKSGIHRSCSLLGKAPADNSDKLKILSQLNPDEVVIYLDNGAYADAVRLCRFFSSKFITKIVVTKPIIDATPSSECLEMVRKIVPVHEEGGEVIIAPRKLQLLKDFIDCISAETPSVEFAKKLKIERYRNDKEYSGYLKELAGRFYSLAPHFKKSFIEIIKEARKWDYFDAGSRSVEENDRLIREALVFNPNFDYEFIERVYEI